MVSRHHYPVVMGLLTLILLPVFVRAYMVTARAAFVDDWVGNLVSSADDTASITPKSI